MSTSDSSIPSDPPSIDGGHGTIPVLGEPDIVLSSAADISSLTPANTVMTAGGCSTVTASQDINLLAQRNHAWAVKDGISFFTRGESKERQRAVQDTGMKFHAASGNVSVQAQSGPLNVTAQQAVDIQSTNADIVISAPNCIVLNGGGGYIKLEGGNIEIGTNGSASFLASLKILEGGAKAEFEAPAMSAPSDLILPQSARHSIQFDLIDLLGAHGDGQAMSTVPYEFRSKDGRVLLAGMTGGSGETGRLYAVEPVDGYLYVGDGDISWTLDVDHGGHGDE
jgi:type VI secretion system secreted protein VgrG